MGHLLTFLVFLLIHTCQRLPSPVHIHVCEQLTGCFDISLSIALQSLADRIIRDTLGGKTCGEAESFLRQPVDVEVLRSEGGSHTPLLVDLHGILQRISCIDSHDLVSCRFARYLMSIRMMCLVLIRSIFYTPIHTKILCRYAR